MLFLNGVALERERKLPEGSKMLKLIFKMQCVFQTTLHLIFIQAIRYYRQAIQLVPDIESRISEFIEEEDNGKDHIY